MRITHIHLMGPYTDGWGYQENILPIVQSKQGNQVSIITNCYYHNPDNSIGECAPCVYDANGVAVYRVKQKKVFFSKTFTNHLFDFPIYQILDKLKPDVILLHGLGRGVTNLAIRKYLRKNKECVLFGDVHSFAGNDGHDNHSLFKKISFIVQQKGRRILYPFYKAVFAVSNQCLDYALKTYKIPSKILRLLPLGFNPTEIDWSEKGNIRKGFRDANHFASSSIVVVHGGKIIRRRKTDFAITACKMAREYLNLDIQLVIFGAIDSSIAPYINSMINQNDAFVSYLGHLSREDYLNVFLSSDIALFPGAQSSIWEEAIGCGLPLVLNYTEINDKDYYDVGGNVVFSENDSAESVAQALIKIIETKEYLKMKTVASTKGREFFSYENISKMMLDEIKNESN